MKGQNKQDPKMIQNNEPRDSAFLFFQTESQLPTHDQNIIQLILFPLTKLARFRRSHPSGMRDGTLNGQDHPYFMVVGRPGCRWHTAQ